MKDATARAQSRLLQVDDLRVTYGRTVAVAKMSLTANAGECLGIVGANGAGKSSLLRAIAGATRIASGTVNIDGTPMKSSNSWDLARRGIRLVPEGRQLFGTMTVLENLRVGARMTPKDQRDGLIDSVLDTFPILKDHAKREARMLSGGQQQMVAIGRALVGKPRILLLDESSLGLAPKVVGELIDALIGIRESGVALVIAEQNLRIPRRVCQEMLVMRLGRVAFSGPTAEVLAPENLRDAFL